MGTGEHQVFWDEEACSQLKLSHRMNCQDHSDEPVGKVVHFLFFDVVDILTTDSPSMVFDPLVLLQIMSELLIRKDRTSLWLSETLLHAYSLTGKWIMIVSFHKKFNFIYTINR